MSSLAKRVDALEEVGGYTNKIGLFVDYASDGGLVCAGKFYPDTDFLLRAKGLKREEVFILDVLGRGLTAAELLEEEAERKRNPPPPVSIDDLGEYGRQLVDEGISPAVAKLLEELLTR